MARKSKGYKYSIVITNKKGTTYTQTRYTKSLDKYNEVMRSQFRAPKQVQTARGVRYAAGSKLYKDETRAREALKDMRATQLAKNTLKEYNKYWSKEEVKKLQDFRKEYNSFVKNLKPEQRKLLPKFNNLIANAKDSSFEQVRGSIIKQYRKAIGSDMKLEKINDNLDTPENIFYQSRRDKIKTRLENVFDKLSPAELQQIEEAATVIYECKDDPDAEESTNIALNTIEDIISKYE